MPNKPEELELKNKTKVTTDEIVILEEKYDLLTDHL